MSETPPRTLVLIVGPPAVGKMTVGQELSSITGYPLFHNHLSIEPVLAVFEFGSDPFNRLVADFRERMFTEVANSDLPGFVFTFVWVFDNPGDLAFVERVMSLFAASGMRTVFVELYADLETRLVRNATAGRLEAKPSKRDVEASRRRVIANDEKHRLNSSGDFPLPDHLWLDNTELSARAAAERIVEHFSLPRLGERRVGES